MIEMLEEMKALVREKNTCVLATISGSKPYCSLMAYVTNKPCTEIYMVTRRQTQKYQNLMANPAVSLMIDSRDTSPRSAARAMTIDGVFQSIDDPGQQAEIRQKLVSVHPHLTEFMEYPDSELIRIKIKSILLLNGLTQSFFEEMAQSSPPGKIPDCDW
jgi:nitroimidazol reductase NimA-like FMN-containing flavoprotein (pyridoxamine 5'-phosphate oxidase superfamily)